MTSQTRQVRLSYAPLYAIALVTLIAVMAIGTSMIQADSQSTTTMMDISAVMGTIDTGNLPVQGHVDAI